MRVGMRVGPFYLSSRIGGGRRRSRSHYRRRTHRRTHRPGPRGIPWLAWVFIGPFWLEYLLLKWMLWVPGVWLWQTWRARSVGHASDAAVTVRQHD